MAQLLAPFLSSFHDFVSDLKSSRRFQVCVVLWLPLVVTSLVAVVRLGLKNTDAKLFPQWKTDFIPESSGVTFPDMTIQFLSPVSTTNPAFPPTGFACSQRGIFAHNVPCPGNANVQQCLVAKLSSFQASQAMAGRNHITCNISVLTTAGVNQELAISTTEGYVWFPNPPTYVNPNALVEIDLFREMFIPMHERPVYEWGVLRNYESSVFNSNPQPGVPFVMSITFHIPFRALIVHRQHVDFDDWQLLAAWGGFFTFMAFLHCIVFWVVKKFTADDSKILGSSTAGPSYEAIK